MRSKKIIIGGMAGVAAACLAAGGLLLLNGVEAESGYKGVYTEAFTAFAEETAGAETQEKLYASKGMKSVNKDYLLIVTAINDNVADYSAIGYEVSVDGGGVTEYKSDTYYTGVSVRTDFDDATARKVYTIAEIYSDYTDFNSVGMLVTEIAYSEESEYTIKPYMISNEGVTVYGTTVTVEARSYLFTLENTTFADGKATVSLKAGEKIPVIGVDSEKTFAGYIDTALNYYATLEDYTMPAGNVTFTALYLEDMALFAPADAPQASASYDNDARGIHKYYNGVIGTEYTFSATDERTRPHSASDSGKLEDGTSVRINTVAPANGTSFMFICVVNNSDKDYTILYQAENYGVQSEDLAITAKAHSTVMVPFHYGNSTNNGSFSACDHWITMKSELAEGETATLGFYGYVYLGGNNAISTLGIETEKTFYVEGENMELSDMTVTAYLGENNYPVALYSHGYICNVEDGQTWTSEIKEIFVSAYKASASLKLNSYDDWVAFTLATTKHDSSVTWVEAEYVAVEGTTLTATRFTIAANTTAGSDCGWNPTYAGNLPNEQGFNVRVPSYKGKTRIIEFHVTNNGTQSVSFRIYSENYGDCGGVDILSLAPGESRAVIGYVCPDGVTNYPNSIGNNYNLKLLSDVGEGGADITVYGYFKTFGNEISAIGLNGASSQKVTFSVGEMFDAEGLTVDVTASPLGQSTDVNITNFTTDWDGHVFTEDEIGTHTVTVTWNGLTTTYEIIVAA